MTRSRPHDSVHKGTKKDKTDSLREDLAAVLSHQYETARHQQDVRDRWYRYYLITAGAVLSLFGTLLTYLLRTDLTKADLITLLLPEKELLYSALTAILALGLILTIAIGVLFLALYMMQIVSYHLNYLTIARMYECYATIHSEALHKQKLPNPFVFTYGRTSEPSMSLPRRLADPQLWAADFWANCIPIFLNAVCLTALSFVWFFPYPTSMSATDAWLFGAGLFTALLLIQILLRQVALVLLIRLAFRNFESRWPSMHSKPSERGGA
jgi:hypothetical protein